MVDPQIGHDRQKSARYAPSESVPGPEFDPLNQTGVPGSQPSPATVAAIATTAAIATERTPRWILAGIPLLVLLIILYLARGILGPFIIAGMLAYIFSMVVDRIQQRLNWPRALTVALLYLAVLGALGVALYFLGEVLYQQTRDFVSRGPNLVETGLQQIMGGSTYTFGGQTYDAHLLADRIAAAISAYLGNGGSGDALHFASAVVGRVLDTLLVIIVSFYLLLGGKQFGSYMLKFVPAESRERTGYVAGRIHAVLGAYLRGQLLLIGLMSFVSFILLQFIFGVPYALPLAILTGFLEIIPLLGPAIAAALAASVTLAAHGPGAAIGVIIAYLILRELEDNLVMPLVVGRVVEVHPVVTIFAVLVGGAIAGVLGMLLAVPAAAAGKVLLDFLYPSDGEEAMAQAESGLARAEREVELEEKAEEAAQEKIEVKVAEDEVSDIDKKSLPVGSSEPGS